MKNESERCCFFPLFVPKHQHREQWELQLERALGVTTVSPMSSGLNSK